METVVGAWREGLDEVQRRHLKGIEEHREKGFRLMPDVEMVAVLADMLDGYDELVSELLSADAQEDEEIVSEVIVDDVVVKRRGRPRKEIVQ